MSHNWEYKFLKKEHKPIFEINKESSVKLVSGFEENWIWTEDNQTITIPVDIIKLSNELGKKGWELITIVSSSTVGTLQLSGLTTQELWVFKRPID